MMDLPSLPSPAQEARVAALERALRVRFRDRRLLYLALVHRSALNEHPALQLRSNERLEFLGDAVLGVIVGEHLYALFPAATEGVLTMKRAALVRESTLAEWARSIRLGEYLVLGRGEELGGARDRNGLLASTFEAVVGAMYLDRGLKRVAQFLTPFVTAELARATDQSALDAKSRLQQLSQSAGALPRYRVLAVTGPQHNPTFTVEVQVAGQVVAQGSGRSKQTAEQAAAEAALARWDAAAPPASEPPPPPGPITAETPSLSRP
jgi:ribonuclease-3